MKKLLLYLPLCLLCLTACQPNPPIPYAEPESSAEGDCALQEDYEALQEAYHVLQAENETLFQDYQELRGLLDYHVIVMPELTGAMFAPDSVEVHGLPLVESAVIGTYRNALVDVHLTVQSHAGLWSLVSVVNLAENVDTVGWLPWNALTVYDPATMESQMTYPVRVKQGTVLYDEVRGTQFISEENYSYLVEYTEKETVLVHDCGGVTYQAAREALVYPSVQDGEIVWGS